MKKLSIVLWFLLLGGMMMPLWGQAQEKLGRGVVAREVFRRCVPVLAQSGHGYKKIRFRYLPDGVKITAAPVVTTTNLCR